jgi:hypothetical protein
MLDAGYWMLAAEKEGRMREDGCRAQADIREKFHNQ